MHTNGTQGIELANERIAQRRREATDHRQARQARRADVVEPHLVTRRPTTLRARLARRVAAT